MKRKDILKNSTICKQDYILNKDDPFVCFNMALYYFNKKRYSDAISKLNHILLSKNGKITQVYILAGKAYTESYLMHKYEGYLAQAQKFFDNAVKLDPENVNT